MHALAAVLQSCRWIPSLILFLFVPFHSFRMWCAWPLCNLKPFECLRLNPRSSTPNSKRSGRRNEKEITKIVRGPQSYR